MGLGELPPLHDIGGGVIGGRIGQKEQDVQLHPGDAPAPGDGLHSLVIKPLEQKDLIPELQPAALLPPITITLHDRSV